MKLRTAIALGVASGLLLGAVLRLRRRQRPLALTTKDLRYQEHSPEELAAENLLDLNTASPSEFLQLGLDSDMGDRITENRPYRNKLDLLSRFVIPEQVYNTIRGRVGVARATEPVKVAE
jgi:hypothetical protein